MKTNNTYSRAFSEVANAESDIFSYLAEISGLDPTTDFRDANLQLIDFEGSKLGRFNFDRADLRGANWTGILEEPFSMQHSLRGNGADTVNGADFPDLASVCSSRANWDERFLAFKLLIDNWGENLETADVLLKILTEDKGTYLRLCASLYFCASYNRDEKMKSRCLEMAKAGRSQINIYRLNNLRKALRDYSKYFENAKFPKRYPGDIDNATFQKIQNATHRVEENKDNRRFL